MAAATVDAAVDAIPAIVDTRYVRVRLEPCQANGAPFHHALKTLLVAVRNDTNDCVRDAAIDTVLRCLQLDGRDNYRINEYRSAFTISRKLGPVQTDYLYLVILFDHPHVAQQVRDNIEALAQQHGMSQHDPLSIDLTSV